MPEYKERVSFERAKVCTFHHSHRSWLRIDLLHIPRRWPHKVVTHAWAERTALLQVAHGSIQMPKVQPERAAQLQGNGLQ